MTANIGGTIIGHEMKKETRKADGESYEVTYLAVKLELQPHPLADDAKPSKAVLHVPIGSGLTDWPIGASVRLVADVPQQRLPFESDRAKMTVQVGDSAPVEVTGEQLAAAAGRAGRH